MLSTWQNIKKIKIHSLCRARARLKRLKNIFSSSILTRNGTKRIQNRLKRKRKKKKKKKRKKSISITDSEEEEQNDNDNDDSIASSPPKQQSKQQQVQEQKEDILSFDDFGSPPEDAQPSQNNNVQTNDANDDWGDFGNGDAQSNVTPQVADNQNWDPFDSTLTQQIQPQTTQNQQQQVQSQQQNTDSM